MFYDVASSCFLSLVPCLKFTFRNFAPKAGNDISFVLKDSDIESENLSSLLWLSVNRQFKRCIIYTYIINIGNSQNFYLSLQHEVLAMSSRLVNLSSPEK